MIDWVERYQTEINQVFSEENKHRLMLKVESTIAQALAETGIIPKEAAEEIKINAVPEKVKLSRVKEIEAETNHDIMALVKAIAEQCPNYGGYVHYGATSQDINDTVLGLQLKEAKKILLQSITEVRKALTKLALRYRDLPAIGRTHGQHAIPITMGFKFANFLYELSIAQKRLDNTKVEYGKLSGAVGTYAALSTDKPEKVFLRLLELETPPIKTQVISRFFLADYSLSLALVASVYDRIAKEIRNLQRTEIGEVMEPFKKKQVGSSTMPQKRNPHKSERVCGISRFIQSQVNSMLQNISLEHERDLTNSSLERITIPTITILTHYITKQLSYILNGLKINKDNVRRNLYYLQGRQLAERIMIALSNSLGRQKAHEILNELSDAKDFEEAVKNHPDIRAVLSPNKIEELLNPETYTGLATKKVDEILSIYGIFEKGEQIGRYFQTQKEEIFEPFLKVVKKTSNGTILSEKAFARGIKIGDKVIGVTTDGVGTKLFIAQMANKHDTVGIDCVAMNVNDLIAAGFIPVGFVDYLAIKKDDTELLNQIAKGLEKGCDISEMPLLGGETAVVPEMINGPGENPYDLAGTAIGIGEMNLLVDGSRINKGDKIIGLLSNGLHSNGYTLARKVLLQHYDINDNFPWGTKVGEELLKPTKIYVKPIKKLLEKEIPITGMVHVTGGGITKLKRLNTELHFKINQWPEIPPIFSEIQEKGLVSLPQMFETFNMGIGFIIIVPSPYVEKTIEILKEEKESPIVLGEVISEGHKISLEVFGVKYE